MAKKPVNQAARTAASQQAWEKVQQRRKELNRKARTRKIIFAFIAIVVAAALTGGIIALLSAKKGETSPANVDTTASAGVLYGKNPEEIMALKTDAERVQAAKGVLIGPEGTWSYTEGAPTFELVFSYSCPACIQVEHQLGSTLFDLAKDGKINLILHPVDTHGIDWAYIAGYASLQVAQDEPAKFVEYSQALFNAGYDVVFKDEESMRKQGNGTALSEEKGSLDLARKVAKQVGVSQSVIDSFQGMAQSKPLLSNFSASWAAAATKVSPEGIGTPMYVRDGKVLDMGQLGITTFDELKEYLATGNTPARVVKQ